MTLHAKMFETANSVLGSMIINHNATCLKHVNMCGERLIWRFSGHASRHLFELGRAEVNRESQKVNLVSRGDVQEKFHLGNDRKRRFRVKQAFSRLLRTLCQASPLKTDLGGEVCSELRQDTT